MARTPDCHPERKHAARGLCGACYSAERRADPAVREREAERMRQRYADDPVYRERQNARRRERMADPAVRERKNALERERYASRKAGAQ